MKVYLVEYSGDYEQTGISAVFDSYEKALEYVNKQFIKGYDIYEWELNTEDCTIL